MRLIDADALQIRAEYGYNDNGLLLIPLRDVKRSIDNAPTVDAVEVVRCKYCKHFTEGMAIGMCKRIPDKPIIPVPYNHFCSYGVRRKGDEDERNER